MLTETHCVCGHCHEVGPAKLPPKTTCPKCGQVSVFGKTGDDNEGPRWLVVGGHTGPARLAVAVPRGVTLTIGRATGDWLILPGDDVADANTEIESRDDLRLSVKHLAKDGATWIGSARIISGVLGDADEMRIGQYVIRLRTSASLAAGNAAGVPDVVVEDVAGDPDEPSGGYDRGDSLWRRILPAEASRGQIVRLWLSVIAILASAGLVVSAVYWPSVSEEMPDDTVYTCPADGETFRGRWEDGPPKCPKCEQLCFGSIRYSVDPPAASQPTSGPAAESAADDATASDTSGAGG